MVTIELSTQRNVRGKSNFHLLGAGWDTTHVSPDEFMHLHYEQGLAIAPGVFKNGKRDDTHWQRSQVLVIDIDEFDGNGAQWTVARYLSHPVIERHAVAIVPSSSYTPDTPKAHIYFVLDRPITDRDTYTTAYKGLLWMLEGNGDTLPPIDEATGRPSQPVFGTVFSKIDAQPVIGDGLSHTNPDVQPLSVDKLLLAGGQYEVRKANRDATNTPAVKTSRPTTHTTTPQALVDAIHAALDVNPANTNNAGVMYTGLECPFHTHTKNPGKFAVGIDGGAGYCIIEDASYSPVELAAQLGIDVKDNRFYERVNDTITPDVTLDTARLPGDLLTEQYTGDVALRSPMGTGKTYNLKQVAQATEGGLHTIIHRVSLAGELSGVLEIENYKALNDEDMHRASKLAIVINSIHKLIDEGGKIPTGGVVLIDEVEQVLAHLGGDTFRKGEAAQALDLLEAIVKNAKRVIVCDAHLTDIGITWLRALRGDVTVIDNVYRGDKGTLTLYDKPSAVEERALAAAHKEAGKPDGLPVMFAGMKERTSALAELAQGQGLSVLLLNSATVTVEDEEGNRGGHPALADINAYISEHKPDIIAYSPTVGSGVSINKDTIAAVYGVFSSLPLAASEIWQMLGRARGVDGVHVYVSPVTYGNRVTDATIIYEQTTAQARKTGEVVCEVVGTRLIINAQGERLFKLQTMIEAHRNHSLNWLEASFLDLNPGYTVTRVNVEASDEHKDASADVKERLQAERLKAVLEAEQIDGGQADHLKRLDGLTADERAMLTRYQIEHATGTDITPTLAGRYMGSGGGGDVSGLYNLAMVRHYTKHRLLVLDKADFETQPDKRGHYTRKVTAARGLFNAVYGGAVHGGQVSAAHIKTCVSAWGGADDFFTDITGRVPKTYMGVFKRVLRWCGLAVERDKKQTDGERVTYYALTPDSTEHIIYSDLGHEQREAVAVEEANAIPAMRAGFAGETYTPVKRDDNYWKGVLMKDEVENTSDNTADTL